MGLSDLFKGNSYKEEIRTLTEKVAYYESLISSVGIEKLQELSWINDQISNTRYELSQAEALLTSKRKSIDNLDFQINEKNKRLVSLDDEVLVQSFGLYRPRFAFASSTDYKDELVRIRSAEKELIKNGRAVTGNPRMTLDGNLKKGQRMVNDIQKLLLRAFNSECDELIEKVKYTNYDASLKRMNSSAEQISKLGSYLGISITKDYLNLKTKELRMAFEFQVKKQEEKELQRELRAQEREAAKLQRELNEQRKKIEKEQLHYERALLALNKQLISSPNDQALLAKKAELENELVGIEKSLTDIDYREANQKAGYVYVISNIGSFGENVFKIGMTRRLNPQERVDELGDASVPFNFDVHAMIFSDNAPALEAALHKAFENKKLNMVNKRREFFHVSLDEIKRVIKQNFDNTVEFVDIPDAEQYRISQKMKEQLP